MLTKILLILFLAYLVNKVLILPFKKEWNAMFGAKQPSAGSKEKETGDSLLHNKDIEDAEFKEIKD